MCASSRNVNIPKPPICVASNMCASSRNVNIPKKPICVASNMCASSRNVNIPKKPICVVQTCVHICVASNMCAHLRSINMYASSKNVNIPKPAICVASNMCKFKERYHPPPHPTPPHPDNLTSQKRKKQFEQSCDKKCTKPSRNACFENLMFFLSQICDENLRVCMSVKRTLKVYERLQIAMNPARAFVTHICKTLKNGTGFQATCINFVRNSGATNIGSVTHTFSPAPSGTARE